MAKNGILTAISLAANVAQGVALKSALIENSALRSRNSQLGSELEALRGRFASLEMQSANLRNENEQLRRQALETSKQGRAA